jgi:hypothetical protein
MANLFADVATTGEVVALIGRRPAVAAAAE